MQTFNTLNDAIALAKFAHFKQQDKAGFPYFDHPQRVMRAVQGQGAAPYVQIAAVLHDVSEDTKFTPQHLFDLGFSEAAVELVKLLDRGYSKQKYQLGTTLRAGSYAPCFKEPDPTKATDFYYAEIVASPAAKMIKVADIADNTQRWRMEYMPVETQVRLYKKYIKACTALGVTELPFNVPDHMLDAVNAKEN